MPRSRRPAAVLACAVVLLAAPAAGAADVVHERHAPLSGPVLHGPRELVWLAGDPGGALEVRAGQGHALLATRASRGRRLIDASLSADGEFVAAGLIETAGLPDVPAVSLRVFAGRAAAGLAPFAGPCIEERVSSSHYWTALSAGALASSGPECDERSLTDLRTGERLLVLPAAADRFERDGAFLAWVERRQIAPGTTGEAVVVRNVETGVQYRVPPALGRLSVVDLDVDARGAVAFLYTGVRGARGLAWATPAQPAPRSRTLPRGWFARDVELSNGVAAVLQAPAGGPVERGRVVLTGLDATAPLRVVASGVDVAPGLRAPLDFDGTRLAVAVRPCGRVDLVLAPLGDPGLRRRPPARCPLRLTATPRLTARTLVASIACDGYRPRCQADTLRATTVRGRRTIARDRFDASLGEVTLRLTRRGRALARRGDLRRVRLSAELGDYVDPRLRDRVHRSVTRLRR